MANLAREMSPGLSDFLAQNLRDSAVDGPNKGKYTEQSASGDRTKIPERHYDIPQNASDSFRQQIERSVNRTTGNYEERAGTKGGQKVKRAAGSVAAVLAPIGVGVAAREGLDYIGMVGGPAAAAIAGVGAGLAEGAIKSSAVDSKTGHGAKEFYQREVSGKVLNIFKGNVFKRAISAISVLTTLPETFAIQKTFNVKGRSENINSLAEELQIDLRSADLYKQIQDFLSRPNLTEYDKTRLSHLLENIMTQATLTGFSESRNEETMARQMDSMYVIAIAMLEKGEVNLVNKSFWNSREEVTRAIRSMKGWYTLASGASRGIKSALLMSLVERVMDGVQGADALSNTAEGIAQEHADRITELQQQVTNADGRINEITAAIEQAQNDLNNLPTYTIEGLRVESIDNIKDYVYDILEKTATEQGFTNVDQYLTAGGQERMLRVDSIVEIYNQIHSKPELLTKLAQTAESIGMSNDQLLEAMMTRAPYDLQGVTINNVQGYGYESVSQWLDALKEGSNDLISIQQGLNAAENNLAGEWTSIWDGLLTNSSETVTDISNVPELTLKITDLNQELFAALNERGSLIEEVGNIVRQSATNLETMKQSVEHMQNVKVQATVVAGVAGLLEAMATMERGSVVYGDGYRRARRIARQMASEQQQGPDASVGGNRSNGERSNFDSSIAQTSQGLRIGITENNPQDQLNMVIERILELQQGQAEGNLTEEETERLQQELEVLQTQKDELTEIIQHGANNNDNEQGDTNEGPEQNESPEQIETKIENMDMSEVRIQISRHIRALNGALRRASRAESTDQEREQARKLSKKIRDIIHSLEFRRRALIIEKLPYEGKAYIETGKDKPKYKTKYYYTNVQETNEVIGEKRFKEQAEVREPANKRLDMQRIEFGNGVGVYITPRDVANILYPDQDRNQQTEAIYNSLKQMAQTLSELSTQYSGTNFEQQFIGQLGSISYVGEDRAQRIYGFLRNQYEDLLNETPDPQENN